MESEEKVESVEKVKSVEEPVENGSNVFKHYKKDNQWLIRNFFNLRGGDREKTAEALDLIKQNIDEMKSLDPRYQDELAEEIEDMVEFYETEKLELDYRLANKSISEDDSVIREMRIKYYKKDNQWLIRLFFNFKGGNREKTAQALDLIKQNIDEMKSLDPRYQDELAEEIEDMEEFYETEKLALDYRLLNKSISEDDTMTGEMRKLSETMNENRKKIKKIKKKHYLSTDDKEEIFQIRRVNTQLRGELGDIIKRIQRRQQPLLPPLPPQQPLPKSRIPRIEPKKGISSIYLYQDQYPPQKSALKGEGSQSRRENHVDFDLSRNTTRRFTDKKKIFVSDDYFDDEGLKPFRFKPHQVMENYFAGRKRRRCTKRNIKKRRSRKRRR